MFNVVFQNGEVCLDESDFEMDGVIPVQFTRVYRSSRAKAGRLGYGWSWGWDIRLVVEQTAYVLDIDHGRVQEAFDAAKLKEGRGTSDEGSHITVLADQITILRSDGFLYRFSFGKEAVDLFRGAVRHNLAVAAIEDSFGNRLVFHNRDGRVEELEDADRHRFRFSYDPSDRIVAVDLVRGCDQYNPPRLFAYEYDSAGDLTRVVDRCGAATVYQYTDHLLVGVGNAVGGWFYAQYDQARCCVRRWRGDGRLATSFRYDGAHHQVLVTDALGYATLYRLNENGQVTEEIETDGNQIVSTFDQNGGLLATTNGSDGNTFLVLEVSEAEQKVIMVDALGGTLVQRINRRTGATRVTDEAGRTWAEDYDQHNLLARTESPLGAVTTYQYDAHGVCVATTEPSGNTIRFEYSPDYQTVLIRDDYGELETMESDVERRLVRCRMALCNAESYTYDALGRITAVKLPVGGTLKFRLNAEGEVVAFVDAAGAETRYEVNPYGEVLTEIDPLGRRIETEYDALAREVCIRNAAREEMHFEFDSLGQLVAQQFFDGRTEHYAYDRGGRLTQIEHADGTLTRFGYHPSGRLATVTPADDEETTFEYDEKGACTKAERVGVAVTYAYDAEGRCILEDQGGVVLKRSFDANDNCVRLEVDGLGIRTCAYDRRNRLVEVVEFDGSRVQLRYDLRNRCLAWEDSSGAGLEFSHGPNDRVERCRLSAGATTEARWQYDAAGRVTQRSVSDRPAVQYQYDLAERLRLRRVGTENESFDFNATDDLLVNPNGEVVGYDRGSNLRSSGATQFELDARGRVVSRSTPRGKTTFVYDAEDYLTRVVHPGGGESAYRFDTFGRRLWKTTGGTRTRFIWNESELLAEVAAGEGAPSSIYLTDPDTGVIRSMVQQGERAFLLTEPTGIPLVAHFAGGLQIQDEPYPWGKSRLSGHDAARQPLRFVGQYADGDTGLHYNRYRFYDPDTGHYLTPDPIGIESALNLYAYVSDPVNTFDPDGLAATTVKKYDCKGKTKKTPAKKREVPDTQEQPCNASMGTSIHNDCINMLREKAEKGGHETRADQKMERGKRMRNRPDLMMSKGGKRVYVEWDYSPASRAAKHKRQICASDPNAVVYLVKIPQSVRYSARHPSRQTPGMAPPKKKGTITRGSLTETDCGIDQIPV